jgi:hypothetical protein
VADTKLSALTALTGANFDPAADLVYVDDVSVTTSKKMTGQELFNALSTLSTITGAGIQISADSIPVYDNSATTEKRILVEELLNTVGSLTAITGANTDTSADSVLIYDNSATTSKKQTVAELNNALNGIGIPQNSQSAAYTTVLADAGKHILHPTADNNARTFTIDSNANVAYPVGTVITFVNQINTVTIAITADTLTMVGTGSTGSRTLAANGMATALKIASTSWVISGTGLS